MIKDIMQGRQHTAQQCCQMLDSDLSQGKRWIFIGQKVFITFLEQQL